MLTIFISVFSVYFNLSIHSFSISLLVIIPNIHFLRPFISMILLSLIPSLQLMVLKFKRLWQKYLAKRLYQTYLSTASTLGAAQTLFLLIQTALSLVWFLMESKLGTLLYPVVLMSMICLSLEVALEDCLVLRSLPAQDYSRHLLHVFVVLDLVACCVDSCLARWDF